MTTAPSVADHPKRRGKEVAPPAGGADQGLIGEGGFDLGPQAAEMDLQATIVEVQLRMADGRRQGAAGDGLGRIVRQAPEQGQFGDGEDYVQSLGGAQFQCGGGQLPGRRGGGGVVPRRRCRLRSTTASSRMSTGLTR